MPKTKPIKKGDVKKSQFVIDAIVVPHSKLELYTSLKNIISFYQHSLAELIAGNTENNCGENIVQCHLLLKKLFVEYKNLLTSNLSFEINIFLMESDSIYKIVAKRKLKNLVNAKQKSLLESKRFTIDYLATSLIGTLSLKVDE